MKISRFFVFLLAVFLIALVVYVFTTPGTNQIQLTGIINGTDAIVSPLVQGRLQKLLVDEGSPVKAGQLIAEIDPTELKAVHLSATENIRTLQARLVQANTTLAMNERQTAAAVQQAEASVTATGAQLEQAKATLSLNEVTYQRDQGLFQGGAISAQERDTAESNYRVAQANVKALEDQVKAAEAQLEAAQANRQQVEVQRADIAATKAQIAQATAQRSQTATQLSYTQVFSPIDGIVAVRVARQGEVVQAGGPIVTVLDVDHLWVQADVEETYIDQIAFGQKLPVRLASGNTLEGTVFYKGVEGDFATQRDVSRTKRDIRTFEIKVAIPNPDRRLFTGMTAYVLLPQIANERRRFHF